MVDNHDVLGGGPSDGADNTGDLPYAWDETRSVQVAIDGRCRLLDLQIAAEWGDYLDADELAPAILMAYGAAVAQAITGSVPTLDELAAVEAPAPPEASQSSLSELAARVPATPDALENFEARLAGLMREVMQDVDGLSQTMRSDPPEPTMHSVPGCLAVSVTADGAIADLSYEEDWISGASSREIRASTLEAYSAAARAAEAAAKPLREQRESLLNRVQKLGDPLEIIKRLTD